MLAFSGWMDGGDVSTGTVERLVHLLDAVPFAEIDPEPFYICNFPGSMEVTALFRPHLEIVDGLVRTLDLPSSTFYCHPVDNLLLFIGNEPNMRWRDFGECVLQVCREADVRRILFVGSFGGTVPHTRQPRIYVTCSDEKLLDEMKHFGVLPTNYEGPGSFTSYLMSQAEAEDIQMTSLVAEIPGYLQGSNPMCIEAVTRRMAKILQLPLDLQSLRGPSTEWELEVSGAIEENEVLVRTVKELEEAYDNELLERGDMD